MFRTLALSSLNSTNVRFIAGHGLQRLALRVSAALTPDLAGTWAEHLFLTPPRPRRSAAGGFARIDARERTVVHRGRKLATWSWGSPDAPAALLAHGWGGSATQLQAFIEPLRSAGFRVVAFDQPAHGRSEGRRTGLPDLADATAHVARAHGGVQAIVAHSLGATAGALAIARGLAVRRIVMVSPPSDLVGYSRRFASWYWVPESVRAAMQRSIEERFDMPWSEVELERIAPKLAADALVIHDRQDRMVPYRQGARFALAWRGARLVATRGLGHGRILEDSDVIAAAVDFVRGGTGGARVARPALPDPAPLY